MRWLEPPGTPAEELLRRALDAAVTRTADDLFRQRVWERLARPRARSKGRRRVRIGILGAACCSLAAWWVGRPRGMEPSPRTAAPLKPVVSRAAPVNAGPGAHAQMRPRRIPVLGGPTTVRTDRGQRAHLRLWDDVDVDLEPNTVFSVDHQDRPSLARGRIRLSAAVREGRRFTVRAGRYSVSGDQATCSMRVDGESVGVDVDDGAVAISDGARLVRVAAGAAWSSSSRPARRPRVDPVAPAPRSLIDVEEGKIDQGVRGASPPLPMSGPGEAIAARAEGNPRKAAELLRSLAQGDGYVAENAAYQLGLVLRDDLNAPTQALEAWRQYRQRFPGGLLRQEVDLSIIQTLLRLDRRVEGLSEAAAFLGRYPDSERRSEVSNIVRALREAGTPVGSVVADGV